MEREGNGGGENIEEVNTQALSVYEVEGFNRLLMEEPSQQFKETLKRLHPDAHSNLATPGSWLNSSLHPKKTSNIIKVLTFLCDMLFPGPGSPDLAPCRNGAGSGGNLELGRFCA